MQVLYTQQQIADRVHAIGQQITADYDGTGEPIVLIGVLKGAAIFLSDLARAIQIDNTFDFVAVSSYGRARVSSGAVKLIKDIDNPIEGRHVILVEDIPRHRPHPQLPPWPHAPAQARLPSRSPPASTSPSAASYPSRPTT